MASHTKFEPSSSNFNGSSSTNGNHESCTTSLGRSGSLREGIGTRFPSSHGPTKSVSLSSPNNIGGIFQSLLQDWKAATLEQKLTRQGEVKKILRCVHGISREVSSSTAVSMKPSPSSAGELKQAKTILHNSYNDARQRAKYFCEAAAKIDKYYPNNLSKKRTRSYFSPNVRLDGTQPGVNKTKNRSQGHHSSSGTDSGKQRPEQRARAAIPIRHSRTSVMEMQTERANAGVKPCGHMFSDKDRLKLVTCGLSISEENAQSLSPGDDWKKLKMKKKRSLVKSVVSETVVLAKPPGPDKEMKRAMQPRHSGSEDNSASSPAASLTKSNASSSAPKSSATSSRVSINISQTQRGPNDSVIVAADHKRSIPTRSSSPSMTQLLGQRLQKMSHTARRENLPPKPVHDDIPYSESLDNYAVNEQNKLKSEFTFSDGLPESEEIRFTKTRPKDKTGRCQNLEEIDVHNLQRSRDLLFAARNSKAAGEVGHLKGGNKIHQRPGCATSPLKSGMPNVNEKLNGHASANQNRRASIGSEKIESVGCLPSKTSLERRRYARQRHTNNNSMDFSDYTIDEHKELLAAANYALHIRHGRSNLFWKKFEPIFTLLSMEDATFLKQQMQFVDEYLKVGYLGDDCDDGRVSFDSSLLTSTSFLAGKAEQHGFSNRLDFAELEQMLDLGGETESFDQSHIGHLVHTKGNHYGISICQALLSAMIEEDENESFYCTGREQLFDNGTSHIQLCVDEDLKAKKLNMLPLDNSQTVKREHSNDYRINTCWSYFDELNNRTVADIDINQMSIEDIILLELNEIGLNPEPVPDLAHCDEGIGESIENLKKKLSEKVMMMKRLLVKLEKVVSEAVQNSESELEHIALDKLVEIAYGKYTEIWASNTGENISKTTKSAVRSFVKKTLARCKTFEQTGRSCFNEPPLQEMFRRDNSNAEHKQGTLDDHIHLKTGGGTRSNKLDKCLSDSFTSFNHLSENMRNKDKCSNRVKKTELAINNMVGCKNNVSFGPHLGLDNLVSGTKGKRSERDRDRKRSNKGETSRNAIGRSVVSTTNGERKNKRKTRHQTTHSSASFNFDLGMATGITETVPDRDIKEKDESLVSGKEEIVKNAQVDFSNLHLPEMDALGVANNENDLVSWLNFEEDGFQDDGSNGLEIPMDDLTDLNMMGLG